MLLKICCNEQPGDEHFEPEVPRSPVLTLCDTWIFAQTRGTNPCCHVDDFLLICHSRDQRHVPFVREDPRSGQPCPDRASNLFSNRQIDLNAFRLGESTNNRVLLRHSSEESHRNFEGNWGTSWRVSMEGKGGGALLDDHLIRGSITGTRRRV